MADYEVDTSLTMPEIMKLAREGVWYDWSMFWGGSEEIAIEQAKWSPVLASTAYQERFLLPRSFGEVGLVLSIKDRGESRNVSIHTWSSPFWNRPLMRKMAGGIVQIILDADRTAERVY